MDEAARYGRLEMLEYFQGQEVSVVIGYFPSTMSPTQRRIRGESFMTQMFVPISDDYLKVHPKEYQYRSEWNSTDPMDDAAANGHLQVVKWLHLNRSEGCTTAAMDCAAANGHLDVVKWLHLYRSEGCTTKAIDGAAENGHLDVIQWLYSNHFERCTVHAIEGAFAFGHLRIVVWLHAHLPFLTPLDVELWRNIPNFSDFSLFQRFHFNNSFNPLIMDYTQDFTMNKSNHKHISMWLHQEFPPTFDVKINKTQETEVKSQNTTPKKSSTQDRKAAAATWADDGSGFSAHCIDELVAVKSINFATRAKVTSIHQFGILRNSSPTIEVKMAKFYSPWDVTETASGLLVPSYVLTQLLPHQREGLEWLHKLHERGVGGILGDDMGLGKTVQLATFLGSLHRARRLRTVLLLCPASVLLQWVRELHKWVPWMRVVLLHASGTGVNTSSSSECYEELIDEVFRFEDGMSDAEDETGVREDERTEGGVVISTYENVRQYQSLFLTREWDYVVLDEGHRIRNPDAETTLVCKQLRTVHRIILSGTPIQNRLRELWSLFDFVYPGRLGTLPTFDDEFVLPIRAGGYATATKMQVLMAYKCALALKDLIQPFLLRRTKKEILTNGASGSMGTLLPGKQEQIIFCRLTMRQRALYKRFLASPEVASVLRRDIRPFRAIS
ncbi:DNA excision repair protein ERCC-6, partial [Phytophthora palmivora]